MPIKCQHCSTEILAEHTKIGMKVDCPACEKRTQLDYQVGSLIPSTGWALSFANFNQLLQTQNSRERVAPMIESWFECEVRFTSDRPCFRKKGDGLFIPEHVHEAIQADSEKQHRLYQAAMDIWR